MGDELTRRRRDACMSCGKVIVAKCNGEIIDYRLMGD